MPPPSTKDVLVILFDLKASPRPRAIHTLLEVILYKQISYSKDQYKLYLVNAAKSSNSLHYEGIFNLDANLTVATLAEEIMAVQFGESDCFEALDVAVEELKTWFDKPGVITLQILFITDLESFQQPKNKKVFQKLIRDIKSKDIFLYVIGPPVDPPKTICFEKDITEWMFHLEVDDKNLNMKIMKDIIQKTPHSVICDYDVGIQLFHVFKYDKGMQPWRVPLTFGTLLSISVSTIRLTKEEPPCKLKKEETHYAEGDKWVYEDQQDIMIDIRDTVNGIIKHGKFVKFENDRRFDIEGPRNFQVLGFTAAKNVPEYFLQSEGSYVVMLENNQSEELMSFYNTLIDELIESNKYMIARRVYNKDTNPRFAALIPRNDFFLRVFIMCYLPYSEDIVHDYKEQDIAFLPEEKVDPNIFKFLSSINIKNDICKIKIPLTPNMTVYPDALGIINKVEEKIIEDKFLKNDFSASSVPKLNLDEFSSSWPVRQLEKSPIKESGFGDFDEVDDFNFS